METEHTTQEISRLRRGINDLASLRALPAIWIGQDRSRVISALFGGLIGMLDLDFAYARFADPASESPREWIRSADSIDHDTKANEVGRALEPYLAAELPTANFHIANPLAEGTASIAVFQLGVQDRAGVFVAGSRRSEFPTETECLLLQVATNQAAVALEEIHRVAQRVQEQISQKQWRSAFYFTEGQRLSHSGSWSFARAGICDYLSQELYQILGFDPAKGIPTIAEYLNIVHPEDRDFVERTINQMVTEGIGCDVKKRIIRPDGELRVIRCVGTPVRENGVVTRFIGTLMDITEQERMAQELRRKEAYLAEAQRLSQTGSFGWSVSSGEIFWSDETFRIFEYDRATCKPTPDLVLQRVHPEDIPLVQRTIDHARQQGKDFDLECRLLMPRGSLKYLHVVARGIRDELDKIEFVGAVTDITPTKRAEEKIRRNEAELRQIIDTIPQLIYALSPEGKVLYANESVLEYSGLSVEDVTADDFRSRFFHPDDLERLGGECRHGLERGQPFELEIRARGKDGLYHWFLVHYKPLRDQNGRILRWYATGTDIDDRRQAEDRLKNETVVLREDIVRSSMFEEIVGSSQVLRKILGQVPMVAPTDSTVLILGETGTGKELIARAIHNLSKRARHAFIRVNCAAIPPSLIASELFGHEKGSFTGAIQQRMGRFEAADGGTIFLDEVGDLPAETQIALLRVLQEREIERVGSVKPIRVDVRVIAATNRDLEDAVASGTFRRDLFYRLNIFPMQIPPLRERADDIPLLVGYFVERYAKQAGKKIRSITRRTLDLFQNYDWPGNIRELQNVVERAVILCDRETFSVDETWLKRESRQPCGPSVPLGTALEEREREAIETALADAHGQVGGSKGAAVKLGIPRQTLESKIKTLGINKFRFKTL